MPEFGSFSAVFPPQSGVAIFQCPGFFAQSRPRQVRFGLRPVRFGLYKSTLSHTFTQADRRMTGTRKPSKWQLELIADAGFAGQSPEKIAAALGITEDEFRAWTASLVATRGMDACALMHPTPAAPPAPGHRPGRVLAERVFEAQPDAPEEV